MNKNDIFDCFELIQIFGELSFLEILSAGKGIRASSMFKVIRGLPLNSGSRSDRNDFEWLHNLIRLSQNFPSQKFLSQNQLSGRHP